MKQEAVISAEVAAVLPAARSDRIDALKFFAIALVVLGHVIALPKYEGSLRLLYYVIGTFNMPLFMFLSGYVLFGREGRSPLAFVCRKFVALIVPYFAWLSFGLVRYSPVSDWGRLLGEAAVNPHNPGRLWFLYVLFVFYVLFSLVRVVSKRDAVLVGAAVAVVCLVLLPDGDYFGRLNVQWLFVFFVGGYLVAKHRMTLPPARPALALGALAAFLALLAVGVPTDSSGWPPWFIVEMHGVFERVWVLGTPTFMLWKYATAFAGIGAASLLYSLGDARRLRGQAFAGRHSLGIYVTQGWLLVLATGSAPLAALGSWVLVLFVALAVAMLLEKYAVTRVVFLGRPARRTTAPHGELSQ